MRDVEINSDKYTVLGVVILIVFMLAIFVSDLYLFANHHVRLPDIHFWDYAVAVFNVYVAFIVCLDSKIRKNYPYGVAGMCLMTVVLLMRIAAYWTKIEATNNLWWTIMAITGIASTNLLLAEAVRWLTRRVRLIQRQQ